MKKAILLLAIGGLMFTQPSQICAAQNVASEAELSRASQSVKHKHYKTAYRRFRKLAQKGCPFSQCIVGIMNQKGVGADKNKQQAVYWFEKSAKQGWKDAEHRLAMMHLNGDGIKKDVTTGVHWLQLSAKHGMSEAQRELADFESDEMRSVKAAAQAGFAHAREFSEEMPSIPSPGNTSDNAYSAGLVNLQKSWVGYVDVVKNLDAAAAASSKR